MRAATVFLAIGFGAALVIAWYHGEQGRQRVTQTEVLLISLVLLGASTAAVVTYRRTPEAAGKASADVAAADGALTTVAVLPFENTSADPQDEYFSDGMTDTLIAELSKLPGLRVISRTSVMQFKGASAPLPEIASQLGVDGILEGTVLREGGRVRITAQLIDARDESHRWAESYEREASHVLEIQRLQPERFGTDRKRQNGGR